MLTQETTRSIVFGALSELLQEAGAEHPAPSGDERLTDLGLTSLLLARLIIQLEMETGVDPFAEDLLLSDVRTVAELIDAYHAALSRSIAV
ncbi:acyl carrier protein [Streptomyces sp. CSDS2]|uniref:acyl carrier protein n=1 Tax=Streptomyces sp. CSDS2 TaxID=3055051 RepID=UPI0025AF19B7|nr:acyl carrier protein [Streptomyces sp. CSDS2]MDN3260901.1 acyl carrier protein [Streptomyces sp. CSDS2]